MDGLELPARYNGGDPDANADPRRLRSRTRLIDAATSLLAEGGVEAVTIDAVTRVSNVARTTLYRHFDNSTQLLVAAFKRLLPRVQAPPAEGTLRERVTELVIRQARIIDDAPIHLTTLAWLALGSASHGDAPPRSGPSDLGPFRSQVVSQYRQPFDEVLGSAQARAELGEINVDMALAQLIGPVVFALLAGMPPLTAADCGRLVDDFFAVRSVST